MLVELTVNDIITINQGILEEWKEEHPSSHETIGVNKDKLQNILKEVEKQDSLIGKTTYFLALIAWAQPFSGGNKRTAHNVADTLLRLSGYKMQIDSKEDVERLRKLLFEIQEQRSELNNQTLSKIALYVSKRIRRL